MQAAKNLARIAVPSTRTPLTPLTSTRKPLTPLTSTRTLTEYRSRYRPLPLVHELRKITDVEEHNEYLHTLLKGMRVILFSNHENTLTRYIATQLGEYDVQVTIREVPGMQAMLKAVEEIPHDVILCPFLTKRIPKKIWSRTDVPTIIIHPGIPGDRGGCSIDWALKNQAPEWGVTAMHAVKDMDAGDIFASKSFPIVEAETTKTEMYISDITDAAMDVALLALVRAKLGIKPVPLDYEHPYIKGCYLPMMNNKDRLIEWEKPAFDVAEVIRMSDTQPGAIGNLVGYDGDFRFYGAKFIENMMYSGQHVRDMANRAKPGEILGWKDEAVLIKCGDNNAAWISHMKDPNSAKPLKLPATSVLKDCTKNYPQLNYLQSYRELWTEVKDEICYVHFDFYNGAMSVTQCQKLANMLRRVAFDPLIKAVVLMGGYRFFSTGIHLNVIEGSDNPEQESYANIVAIDDVIRELFSIKDKVTVAALQGNAGAGGAMMAQACDFVIAHKSVVLTPTYKSMDLYGSEYWTYFLPKRVGKQKAVELTSDTKSYMASTAHQMGMVDFILGRTRREMLGLLHSEIIRITRSTDARSKVDDKLQRSPDWYHIVEEHRADELRHMKKCFADEGYHEKRRKFVYH